MTSLAFVRTLLWTLNITCRAGVAIRLLQLGLHRTYRWFFLYWTLSLVRSLILYPLDIRGQVYFRVWKWTEPVIWLLQILVVLELYHLVLRPYRGIYSLGRWFFWFAVGVAVAVASASVARAWEPRPPREIFFLIHGGIQAALAIFILLLIGFIAFYPMPLARNLIVHCCVYGIYFFSQSAVVFMRFLNVSAPIPAVSSIYMAVGIGCQLAWMLLLSRKGEEETTTLGLHARPEDQKRLLEQLNALNATLLHTAKK